jgi:hypothetical protein
MRHKEEVAILPITVLVYSLVIYAVAKYLNELIMTKQGKTQKTFADEIVVHRH